MTKKQKILIEIANNISTFYVDKVNNYATINTSYEPGEISIYLNDSYLTWNFMEEMKNLTGNVSWHISIKDNNLYIKLW